jgi:transposase
MEAIVPNARTNGRKTAGGRLLKAGKLSQAEIARQVGVSRATVSDWAKVVESQGIKARGVEAKLS